MKQMRVAVLIISCTFIWIFFLVLVLRDVNGLQRVQANLEMHQKHLAGEACVDQNYVVDRIYAQYMPQIIAQYRKRIFLDVMLLTIQTVSCVIALVDEFWPAVQKKEGET